MAEITDTESVKIRVINEFKGNMKPAVSESSMMLEVKIQEAFLRRFRRHPIACPGVTVERWPLLPC